MNTQDKFIRVVIAPDTAKSLPSTKKKDAELNRLKDDKTLLRIIKSEKHNFIGMVWVEHTCVAVTDPFKNEVKINDELVVDINIDKYLEGLINDAEELSRRIYSGKVDNVSVRAEKLHSLMMEIRAVNDLRLELARKTLFYQQTIKHLIR